MTSARLLAAAQTVPAPGEVEANLDEHLRLARRAAEEGAGVVVFPELSLTGYELGLAEQLAFLPEDERLAPLRGLAAAAGLTIVAGAPVRRDGVLVLGALILRPDGGEALYTKRHLGVFSESAAVDGTVPPAEATVFAPGTLDPLVELDSGTAAIALCADAGRPAHSEAAAARGACTYLAAMFVIPSEFESERERLPSIASRHRMIVVFANYGGPSGGLASAGRSAIWSADGELLAELGPTGAGLVVGDGATARAVRA